jgi:hypothetical protein
MLFHRGNQESAILRTFGEHLVVRDDLVLGFLHLNHVPELVWLAPLPLANDFRVRLEKTHDLVRILGNSSKHSRLGLPHHLSHTPSHRFQDLPESFPSRLPVPSKMLHFFQHSFRLMHNLSRYTHQFPISLDTRFPAFRSLQPPRQGHHLLVYTAHAVTNPLFQPAGSLLDLLHGSREHARSIP